MAAKERKKEVSVEALIVEVEEEKCVMTRRMSEVKAKAAPKSARKVPATPASNLASPQVSAPSSSKASSPLSPTRLSRLQEKAELQNLNDRLAAYIDRVRNLEAENNRLTIQVQTSQETVTNQVTSVKNLYEKELSETRGLLDELAKDKARLQIDFGRVKGENEELLTKLAKKEHDLSVAERSNIAFESRINDLNAQLNQARMELKRAQDELKAAVSERDKLRGKVPELQSQLEAELLARTDLENRITSLREEVAFKEQVHEREIVETRSSKQTEISEIDGRLQEQYEARLQETLQELREQYESQMFQNKEEIRTLYENKMRDMEEHAKQQYGSSSQLQEELLQYRTRIDGMTSRVAELESANASLQARIRDLERSLDNERSQHAESLQRSQSEMDRLRQQMSLQLQEYQDLMDIRTALDMEIAAYRKLLEGEESRLNLTMTSPRSASAAGRITPVGRATPLRGIRRKRTVLEESSSYSVADFKTSSSAKGEIEVTEVDAEGKFVKLTNNGDKEVSLSGWQIVHTAGANETVYKFHRTLKLSAGASVCVWSAGVGANHEPPANLVMKEQRWFVADAMTTVLVNAEGEEQAKRECVKEHSSSALKRQREELRGSRGAEELHHQQGDPAGQERCSIM